MSFEVNVSAIDGFDDLTTVTGIAAFLGSLWPCSILEAKWSAWCNINVRFVFKPISLSDIIKN